MKWENEKCDHHFSWLVINPTSQERNHSCYSNCCWKWHSSLLQHGSIDTSKWNETAAACPGRDTDHWCDYRPGICPTGPRHVCDICIFLRTFPQTRHRASSVFCLQRGVEYRPSDSFLFRLKRRLGCWAQPPEQNFAMSIIYNWHVLQQLTAAQFTDEKLWRGSASKVPTLPRHTSCAANRSSEPVRSIGPIRRACESNRWGAFYFMTTYLKSTLQDTLVQKYFRW